MNIFRNLNIQYPSTPAHSVCGGRCPDGQGGCPCQKYIYKSSFLVSNLSGVFVKILGTFWWLIIFVRSGRGWGWSEPDFVMKSNLDHNTRQGVPCEHVEGPLDTHCQWGVARQRASWVFRNACNFAQQTTGPRAKPLGRNIQPFLLLK